MLNQEKILQALDTCTTISQLEDFFHMYLGKTGEITSAFKNLKSLSPEQKKEQGSALKEIKNTIEQAYQHRYTQTEIQERNQQLLYNDPIDISVDGPASYQ